MYVCICRAVNETTIKEACATGIRTVEELSERLGVGGSCGQCREQAHRVLESCRSEGAPAELIPC